MSIRSVDNLLVAIGVESWNFQSDVSRTRDAIDTVVGTFPIRSKA